MKTAEKSTDNDIDTRTSPENEARVDHARDVIEKVFEIAIKQAIKQTGHSYPQNFSFGFAGYHIDCRKEIVNRRERSYRTDYDVHKKIVISNSNPVRKSEKQAVTICLSLRCTDTGKKTKDRWTIFAHDRRFIIIYGGQSVVVQRTKNLSNDKNYDKATNPKHTEDILAFLEKFAEILEKGVKTGTGIAPIRAQTKTDVIKALKRF